MGTWTSSGGRSKAHEDGEHQNANEAANEEAKECRRSDIAFDF